MVNMEYSKERLNLLYEFAYKQLGARQRFGTDVIGETPEERRSNILFLYKFILRDVLKLSKEEARLAEEKYGLSKCAKKYIYLLTSDIYQEESLGLFYPNSDGLAIEIIYNDWDCDGDIIKIYEWIENQYIYESKLKQYARFQKHYFETLSQKHLEKIAKHNKYTTNIA